MELNMQIQVALFDTINSPQENIKEKEIPVHKSNKTKCSNNG